ncbi:hypothetical protein [Spirillospora sp. CA-128828]|uniref:hypothetical protein n=1 Tax=Spirillospora sp. CA-128828 TaxID=3240033 RepID=UPI003D8D3E53
MSQENELHGSLADLHESLKLTLSASAQLVLDEIIRDLQALPGRWEVQPSRREEFRDLLARAALTLSDPIRFPGGCEVEAEQLLELLVPVPPPLASTYELRGEPYETIVQLFGPPVPAFDQPWDSPVQQWLFMADQAQTAAERRRTRAAPPTQRELELKAADRELKEYERERKRKAHEREMKRLGLSSEDGGHDRYWTPD